MLVSHARPHHQNVLDARWKTVNSLLLVPMVTASETWPSSIPLYCTWCVGEPTVETDKRFSVPRLFPATAHMAILYLLFKLATKCSYLCLSTALSNSSIYTVVICQFQPHYFSHVLLCLEHDSGGTWLVSIKPDCLFVNV